MSTGAMNVKLTKITQLSDYIIREMTLYVVSCAIFRTVAINRTYLIREGLPNYLGGRGTSKSARCLFRASREERSSLLIRLVSSSKRKLSFPGAYTSEQKTSPGPSGSWQVGKGIGRGAVPLGVL